MNFTLLPIIAEMLPGAPDPSFWGFMLAMAYLANTALQRYWTAKDAKAAKDTAIAIAAEAKKVSDKASDDRKKTADAAAAVAAETKAAAESAAVAAAATQEAQTQAAQLVATKVAEVAAQAAKNKKAQDSAQAEAANAVAEVKKALMAANASTDAKLSTIHALVNNEMHVALTTIAQLLAEKAERTGAPSDLAAAEAAQTKLEAHDKNQAAVDAMEAGRG